MSDVDTLKLIGQLRFIRDYECKTEAEVKTINEAIKRLSEKRKTGQWTHGREVTREMIGDSTTSVFYDSWKCSECQYSVKDASEPMWNFCPNCGCEMEVEHEYALEPK